MLSSPISGATGVLFFEQEINVRRIMNEIRKIADNLWHFISKNPPANQTLMKDEHIDFTTSNANITVATRMTIDIVFLLLTSRFSNNL